MAKPVYYTVIESFAGDGFDFQKGEVVNGDDPAVKKWPAHFGPLIVREDRKVTVEQATAAPGETR